MQKEIILEHSQLLLDTPEENTGKVVLFLPGISGKAFSERFQPLVELVLEKGFAIARMHAWEDEADVCTKTLSYFDSEIKSAVMHLKETGFTDITLVGKSFGGGLSLAHRDPAITKKILWAPAIGMNVEGTYDTLKDVKLREVTNLLDIQLKTETVANDPAEICIVHGTKDDVIPLENSKAIIDTAQRGMLEIVEGADHSFKTPEQESALLSATKKFLT